MNKARSRLILALVATVLLLLAFLGTTLLSFPIWFRYRDAAGLSTTSLIAQIAAALAAVGFFVVAGIVAVGTALQPAGGLRKLRYVLPVYLLGFTLVGLVLAAFGIGTVGPFIATWLGVGGVLCLISIAIAIARVRLGQKVLKAAMRAMSITAILGLIAWLAMVVSIGIVSTGTPSTRQGGAQGAPAGSSPPAAPVGQEGPGQGPGGPGGPGRGAASTAPLLIGGALMTIFAAIALVGSVSAQRAVHGDAPEADAPIASMTSVDLRREAGRAIIGSIGITLVAFVVSQLVPVTRDNPPTQTAVAWDSPQTQAIAKRACMDCHSNETRWPWYSYIAPGSWLTRIHVSDGRASMNLSALNNLPSFRASRLPEDVAQQIRNGAMPPQDYLLIHSDARLSKAEVAQLIQGLQASLRSSLPK